MLKLSRRCPDISVISTALLIVLLSLPVASQQLASRAAALPSSATPPRPMAAIDRAVTLSGNYLERASGPNGKFSYRVALESGHVSSSYNIVRHAGAIYALAMFNGSHPNRNAVDAMTRAANFMRSSYISQDARSKTLVVWSQPVGHQNVACE